MDQRQPVIRRCRMARRILDHLISRTPPYEAEGLINSLASDVEQLQRHMRSLVRCHRRNWCVASDSVALRMRRWLQEAQNTILAAQRHLSERQNRRPSFRDVVEDLAELEQEFDPVHYRSDTLIVATDSIELDEIDLGPFEIHLPLTDLTHPAHNRSYRVIALDPRAAAADSSVTHPHVQDGILCEGEATVAIRNALRDARICDFFVLVRSVLQTYNSGSPYVPIDDWNGLTCRGCEQYIGRDDRCCCTGCDIDRCVNCIAFCKRCDNPFCDDCVRCCNECLSALCDDCAETCSACGVTLCTDCLESGCECQKEDDHEDQTQTPQTIGSAV